MLASTNSRVILFVLSLLFVGENLIGEEKHASYLFADEVVTQELSRARNSAKEQNTRILVVLGASWCKWCKAMNTVFEEPQIKEILDTNYQVVKVDIGRFDTNLDVVSAFGADIKQTGIPLFVLLDIDGTVLAIQQTKIFESGPGYDSRRVYDFLTNAMKGAVK